MRIQKGDEIWISNIKKIATIIDIKEEWTPYPHGSGTTYYIYTLKTEDNNTIIYDTLENDYFNLKTKSDLICDKKYIKIELEEKKKKAKQEIEAYNQIINKFSL